MRFGGGPPGEPPYTSSPRRGVGDLRTVFLAFVDSVPDAVGVDGEAEHADDLAAALVGLLEAVVAGLLHRGRRAGIVALDRDVRAVELCVEALARPALRMEHVAVHLVGEGQRRGVEVLQLGRLPLTGDGVRA